MKNIYKITSALCVALLAVLVSAQISAQTPVRNSSGAQMGSVDFPTSSPQSGPGWVGSCLEGGYQTTNQAAQNAEGCAQMRWIQIITTDCPLGGVAPGTPYVDPTPNPDGSPYYYDDTPATSGEEWSTGAHTDTTVGGVNYHKHFHDYPRRRTGEGAWSSWCASLYLICEKADGTVVPLTCTSWGFTYDADEDSVTNKPVTTDTATGSTITDGFYDALGRQFPNVTVGVRIYASFNRIPRWPYGPNKALALVNSTGRKQCDVWLHVWNSPTSADPFPIDGIEVEGPEGKNWEVASPEVNDDGTFREPTAWIKLQAKTDADCLQPGESIKVKLGKNISAKGKSVNIYPTNAEHQVITDADTNENPPDEDNSDPHDGGEGNGDGGTNEHGIVVPDNPLTRWNTFPVRDFVMHEESMYLPGKFCAIYNNETEEPITALRLYSNPGVEYYHAEALNTFTGEILGGWDGKDMIYLFEPLQPGDGLDIAYHFYFEDIKDAEAQYFTTYFEPQYISTSVGNALESFINSTQLRPNPSAGETTIELTFANNATVDIEIWNVSGQRVATLTAGYEATTGVQSFSWDGRNSAGEAVAPGVYYVRIISDGVSAAKPLVIRR